MILDDVSKYLMEKPIRNRLKGKNQGEILTYASDALIPGLTYYAQLRWITGMPEPDVSDKGLVSDCNKIVLFWGNDYKEPENLGAEIEFMLDGTPLRFSRSTAIFIPEGVSHGPAIWKG